MSKRKDSSESPRALDLIHSSLDRGYPVLAWDISFPNLVRCMAMTMKPEPLREVCGKADTLPCENLGRSVMEELFVLAIEGSVDLTLQQKPSTCA